MWEEGKVRIKDIAEELGVSTATVSNVLHGKTQKISDATVKAVERRLEERGYIPNMAATLLARNNSRIIGVVVNDHPKYEGHALEDSFISAALNRLADEIERRGYFMMLKKAKIITEIVRFASMWNMDGVVITGFCEDEYQDLRDRIRVPFVVYDGFPDRQNRFGNITICVADNKICMDLLRYQGLCEGLGFRADFWQIPMQAAARRGFYADRLELLKGYTAVFAASDFYALELMRFLQTSGVRVPEDISVAGFDGSRDAAEAVPRLTTVRQDAALRATAALDLLLDMVGGGSGGKTVCIPVALQIADSTTEI